MNESQTIAASEFNEPNETTISEPSSQEIYKILAAKVLRGCFICAVLYVTAIVGVVVAIAFYHSTLWVILSGILGIASKCGAMLGYQKLQLARRISVEPQLVYWAHPALLRLPLFRSAKINISTLTLHLRTGKSLEVSMPRAQIIKVVSWLRRCNSGLRFGYYDAVPAHAKGQTT